MAVFSSIMKAGLGIRLVFYDGLEVNSMEILDGKYLSGEYLGDEF